METAGEGGAWGIALLGSYLVNNEKKQSWQIFWKTKYSPVMPVLKYRQQPKM